jgi:hypothetical protein
MRRRIINNISIDLTESRGKRYTDKEIEALCNQARIEAMHTAWARALHGVNSGDDLKLIREYVKNEFDVAQKEYVELQAQAKETEEV